MENTKEIENAKNMENIKGMKTTKEQKKVIKNNLAFQTFRLFTTVPKNCILIVENKFTKEAKVVEGGFYFSIPFVEETTGISLESKIYDFPPQVFQAGVLLENSNVELNDEQNEENKNFDIEVDAAITYRVKGGDKPSEEIIKSKNKDLRRQWRKEHGALRVYYDLGNNQSKINKQLQTIVYDSLRKYIGTHTYEEILSTPIDENSMVYNEISQELDKFGIEVVNFKIQNVNQIKAINEAEAKAKALQMEAEAKAKANIIEAEAKAKANIIEAEATAKATELQGAADAKNIEVKGAAEAHATGQVATAKVEAFSGKTYQEIAAMNGQDFKQVNINLTNPTVPIVNQPVNLNEMVGKLDPEQRKSLFSILEGLQEKTESKNQQENKLEDKKEEVIVIPEPVEVVETVEQPLTEENIFDEKEEVVIVPETIEVVETVEQPLTEENIFDEKEEIVIVPETIETIEKIESQDLEQNQPVLEAETIEQGKFKNYQMYDEMIQQLQQEIDDMEKLKVKSLGSMTEYENNRLK